MRVIYKLDLQKKMLYASTSMDNPYKVFEVHQELPDTISEAKLQDFKAVLYSKLADTVVSENKARFEIQAKAEEVLKLTLNNIDAYVKNNDICWFNSNSELSENITLRLRIGNDPYAAAQILSDYAYYNLLWAEFNPKFSLTYRKCPQDPEFVLFTFQTGTE